MRIMQYTVEGGCRQAEMDCPKPKWSAYGEAERQLKDMVEAINSRMGSAVKEASFDTMKPELKADLLYADSGMVAGMFQNGALERELTVIATRFGHRVDRIETNMATLAPLQQPSMTVFLAQVQPPEQAKKTTASKVKKKTKKAAKKKMAKKTAKTK